MHQALAPIRLGRNKQSVHTSHLFLFLLVPPNTHYTVLSLWTPFINCRFPTRPASSHDPISFFTTTELQGHFHLPESPFHHSRLLLTKQRCRLSILFDRRCCSLQYHFKTSQLCNQLSSLPNTASSHSLPSPSWLTGRVILDNCPRRSLPTQPAGQFHNSRVRAGQDEVRKKVRLAANSLSPTARQVETVPRACDCKLTSLVPQPPAQPGARVGICVHQLQRPQEAHQGCRRGV